MGAACCGIGGRGAGTTGGAASGRDGRRVVPAVERRHHGREGFGLRRLGGLRRRRHGRTRAGDGRLKLPGHVREDLRIDRTGLRGLRREARQDRDLHGRRFRDGLGRARPLRGGHRRTLRPATGERLPGRRRRHREILARFVTTDEAGVEGQAHRRRGRRTGDGRGHDHRHLEGRLRPARGRLGDGPRRFGQAPGFGQGIGQGSATGSGRRVDSGSGRWPRWMLRSTTTSFGPPTSSRCSTLSRRSRINWRALSSSYTSTMPRRGWRARAPRV